MNTCFAVKPLRQTEEAEEVVVDLVSIKRPPWQTPLVVLFMAALSFFSFQIGYYEGSLRERLTAVECGVAEWRVNALTGEVIFVYGNRIR